MSVNYLARSADLKVNGFPDGTASTDIAKAIIDYFNAQNVKVLAIQQCRNKIARVTFDNRTACELIRLRVELDMDGVKVPVIPPPPNWVNVVVYNYPYDAPDEYITDVLYYFGKIHNIRCQHWTNLPEVATGTRVVRINLRKSIPRFVMFGSYRCKVWYRGQPTYCDICKEKSHIAFNCPYKGKCLSCKESDHVAHKCPTVCFKCKGDHPSDSCPNRRRWEYASRDDSDAQSTSGPNDAGGANDDAGVVAGSASEDLTLAEAASARRGQTTLKSVI